MITVKKDAIKIKTSEGMQSVGVLANVGTFGVDYLRYCMTVQFNNLNVFEREEVNLNLDNATSFAYLYQADSSVQNKTVKHIIVNCPNKITTMRDAFSGQKIYDETLEHITLNVDTSESQWWLNTFYRMYALRIIDGTPLDLRKVNSNGYSNMFGICKALVEVRFAEGSIVKTISFSESLLLSDVSRQSIIDGLADLTGQTAQTLTLHNDVKAKLTEEQIATITSKNWTLA